MSLQKKIIIGFLLSACIVAALAIFEYINFIKIRGEIRFLETTDSLRSKSLQLRRHEKNFILNYDFDEAANVRDYIKQIHDIIAENRMFDRTGGFASYGTKVEEYAGHFKNIEALALEIGHRVNALKPAHRDKVRFFAIIEATFLERPLVNATLIKDLFNITDVDPLITDLTELYQEIANLRKTGEEVLVLSKELDSTARANVDNLIRVSQIAIVIVFPVFLAFGFGFILIIIGGVVRKLHVLSGLVEKAAAGHLKAVSEPSRGWGADEVGQLIRTFINMDRELAHREHELLQSKKLAAIGTFASGVAHELNNPLNNIYTTAQRLMKRKGDDIPDSISRGLDDIFSQTMRVKNIVSDLLEFARGREPHMLPVELSRLIRGSYELAGKSRNAEKVRFRLRLVPEEIVCSVDTEQMERVFINLFSNALDALSGEGTISVEAVEEDSQVKIRVADTGKGIPREDLDKIFEPFYTTKDKGTGLGLAIVFNIIQRHGGAIFIGSEPGTGTAFQITLPKKISG